MNKKILLALILAGVMALSMDSCKGNEEVKETDADVVTDTKAADTTAFPLFDGTYQTEDNSGWGPIIKP